MTTLAAAVFAGLLASAGLTRWAIAYAHHRQMLDWPGARRSHARPTPRGGGIGVILVVLLGGLWLALRDRQTDIVLLACVGALAAVAAIGWIDDHRPLSPMARAWVHLLAAAVAATALIGLPQTLAGAPTLLLVVFFVAGSINAWNFIDGADALAASQGALVVASALVGGWLSGAWQVWAALALAGIVGFLPFNALRARIFLGDVGSGALGCLTALLLARAVRDGGLPWTLACLPPSAVLIDAGATLGLRVVRGRRWWQPHREHAYQWLVRCGYGHGVVAAWYALWTVQASALALCLTTAPVAVRLALTLLDVASGVALWLAVRNRLWKLARTRRCVSA